MITVSQLAAFDPSSWDRAAEWARAKSKKAREAQNELGSQADKLAKAWPSWVGQLAVSAIRTRRPRRASWRRRTTTGPR